MMHFGVSTRKAQQVDPKHRHLLEVTRGTLADADSPS